MVKHRSVLLDILISTVSKWDALGADGYVFAPRASHNSY